MFDAGPLRTFLVLAEAGRMSRAAALLHLSQPAISAQLAGLEEDLGTPLFFRTPKGLVLTDAGRIFQGHVERAMLQLRDAREAVKALAGLEKGELAIGGGATATTYLLPRILREFHEQHPGIRLRVREQGSRAVVDAVLGGELDLGIVTQPIEAPYGRLRVLPWVEDELLLIVPPKHRLAARRSFRWKELEGQPLVMFEGQSAVRDLIERQLALAGVEPVIVMELRSIDAILQMVQQGIGAGFVSRWALVGSRFAAFARGPSKRHAGLRSADQRLVRTLAIVSRADRAPTAAASAFVDLMQRLGAN